MTVLALYAHNRAFFDWDVTIARWVMDIPGPGVGTFMEVVSWPGVKPVIAITALTGTALATWLLGWRAGLLVLSGLLVTGLNEEFKEIIGRARPEDVDGLGSKSFPSGHTLYASLISGVTWLLVAPNLSRKRHRFLLVGTLIAWVLLTGISRIYLEKHWPSDVLGSYLLASSVLLVMAWAIPVLDTIRIPFSGSSENSEEAS